MKKNFLDWLKAALIRAGKTFVQSATSLLSTAVVFADVNVLLLVNTAGLSAIASLFTSMVGLPELGDGNESKYKAMIVRAVKTVAQTALSYIATLTLVSEVDWARVASASLLAGLISLGMNFHVDLPEVE